MPSRWARAAFRKTNTAKSKKAENAIQPSKMTWRFTRDQRFWAAKLSLVQDRQLVATFSWSKAGPRTRSCITKRNNCELCRNENTKQLQPEMNFANEGRQSCSRGKGVYQLVGRDRRARRGKGVYPRLQA